MDLHQPQRHLILVLLLLSTFIVNSIGDVESEDGSSGRQSSLLRLAKSDPKFHRSFPVVEPDIAHTKLRVSKEGLDVISRITNPIAVVAVIGPYRSGKSFLLNQLLSLSCNEGFGVGHQRDTKTKGIWVWGEPMEVDVNGVTTSVLFLDTEGFESVRKSSVYDDRIFALAAVLSSVLIYNLAETVKEADIAKLSFAVELAEEFYGRVKGRQETFTPSRLLWLIQRDFLEGKTVQEMVRGALQPVPNPDDDKDVHQLNQIRTSLSLISNNSTAFGLTQPHLQRTHLCEMDDSQLDQKYVRQRDELRRMVAGLVAPKIVAGHTMNGEEFGRLLEQTLHALNEGNIPTAGSVVDAFNRAVVERCIAVYEEKIKGLPLPADESAMQEAHEEASAAALKLFDQERFGGKKRDTAERPLRDALSQALSKLEQENKFASSTACEKAYVSSEEELDGLVKMRLPSVSKFDARLRIANESVERACKGPSRGNYVERMHKTWARERDQFLKDYNQRLFNWLVIASLCLVVVGRFVLKWAVVEVLAWALFVFLETYTRIFFSLDSLYLNPTWRTFVDIWEAVVYNPVIDLDMWAIPVLWVILITAVVCRFYVCRKRPAHQHSSLLPTHISPSVGRNRSE